MKEEQNPDTLLPRAHWLHFLFLCILLCLTSVIFANLSSDHPDTLSHPLLLPITGALSLISFFFPAVIIAALLLLSPIRKSARLQLILGILVFFIGLLFKECSSVDDRGEYSLELGMNICLSVSLCFTLLPTLFSIIQLGGAKRAAARLLLASACCAAILLGLGHLMRYVAVPSLLIGGTMAIFCLAALLLKDVFFYNAQPSDADTKVARRANVPDFALVFSIILIIAFASFVKTFELQNHGQAIGDIELSSSLFVSLILFVGLGLISFKSMTLVIYLILMLLYCVALPSPHLDLSFDPEFDIVMHWPYIVNISLLLGLLCMFIAIITRASIEPLMTLYYGYALCFVAFFCCFFPPMIIVFLCVFLLLPVFLLGKRYTD